MSVDYTVDGKREAAAEDPWEEELVLNSGTTETAVPVTGLNPAEMEGAIRDTESRLDVQRVYEQGNVGLTKIIGVTWDPTDWMTVVILSRNGDADCGWELAEYASHVSSRSMLWERDRWVEEFFLDCTREGIDPTPIFDWFMTTPGGHTQSEWAEERGTTQQAISDNVLRAAEQDRR